MVQRNRAVKEGIGFGVVAGLVFAVVALLVSGLTGEAGLMPLRMTASVVMGGGAMTTNAVAATVLVGVVVHLVLSGAFGAVYGVVDSRMSVPSRTSFSKQALFGMVFGILLWFVNFQIIARLLYPWFLAPPQGVQMLLHALCYGLPLALMFAAYERSVRHGPPVLPTPV